MDELKLNIKRGFGKFNSLDKAYGRFIKNLLINCDDNERERWNTYFNIIEDILYIERIDYFEEMKYKVTGGENMNQIMMDIINKDPETKAVLKKYINTIKYYMDIDLISRFCK